VPCFGLKGRELAGFQGLQAPAAAVACAGIQKAPVRSHEAKRQPAARGWGGPGARARAARRRRAGKA